MLTVLTQDDVQIDVRRLKMTYSDSEGLPIAYLFHKKLLKRSLKYFSEEARFPIGQGQPSDGTMKAAVTKMLSYREQLLMWLVNLMRSPLPKEAKFWCVAFEKPKVAISLGLYRNGGVPERFPVFLQVSQQAREREDDANGKRKILIQKCSWTQTRV